MREIKFRVWDNSSKRFVNGVIFDAFFKEPYANIAKDLIVMQYTGLKDKNGVEIYEGDVVRIGGAGSPLIFIIEYKPEWAAFVGRHVVNEKRTRFADVVANDISEVIGNIYENPELNPSLTNTNIKGDK